MKLIYASDAFLSSYRANAIHVMKMCNAFSKYFESVILYCHEWNGKDDVYEKYGVNHSFLIKKEFFQKLGCLNIHLQIVLSSLLNAISIYKNREEIVVYSRSTLTLFFLRPTVKFVYEVHSMPEKGLFKYLESKLLKRKSLQYLVTISRPLKERYSELYPHLRNSHIVVLHDGADCVSDFTTRKELRSLEGYNDDVKIGYIGSLYYGKCMEVLIPIAKKMSNQLFHVVGGNPEWVDYWSRELEKASVNNVLLYGMVAPGEVGLFYNSFDICILPYSNNIYVDKDQHLNIGQWISPLKLFESMSYGKAIVVSDLPSIREVMHNGEDCRLISPNNIEEWVDCLKELISSKPKRHDLGINAKKKLEEQFSWDKRAEKVYNLLK